MSAPTPWRRADRAPQMTNWLTEAERLQLERGLNDLPELADQLEANYGAFVMAGSSDEVDRRIRHPLDPEPADLADRRSKGPMLDPIGEANLTRSIGERRAGVLPTLTSWVVLVESEMLDLSVQHADPLPAAEATVTSQAGWLSRHLDWIGGQQYVRELFTDVADLVADLTRLVGPAYAKPNDRTVLCSLELAEVLEVEHSTVRGWKFKEWIDYACDPEGRFILDDRGRRTFYVTEARAVARSVPTRKGAGA